MPQGEGRPDQSREGEAGTKREIKEIARKHGLSLEELATIVDSMIDEQRREEGIAESGRKKEPLGERKEAGEPKIESYKDLLSYARESLVRVKQELNAPEGSALYVMEDHLFMLDRLISDSDFSRHAAKDWGDEKIFETNIQGYWFNIIRLKLILEAFFIESPHVKAVFSEEDWSKVLSLHETFKSIATKMDNYFRDYLGVELDKVELLKKVPKGVETIAGGEDFLTTQVSGLASRSQNLGKGMSKIVHDAYVDAGSGRALIVVDIAEIGYKRNGQQIGKTVLETYYPMCWPDWE